MMLEIIDCEQGSDEWFRHRMGIPTASEFKTIIGIKKDAKEKKTRQDYLMKLAGEICSDEPMEKFSNSYMDRGKVMEPELRNLYCMMADCDVTQVGFLRNGKKGASPDSLIGNSGMLEIKSESPHLLVATILADVVPPKHNAQLQGNLLVAEREWIDIALGYTSKKPMPLVIKRAYRDEKFLKELSAAIDEFNDELAEVVRKVQTYGG